MELARYPQAPSEPVGEYAYRVLRENIIRMRLEPGRCLSPVEMAEALQVSRTPIQSAFARLSADGLLDIYPQRGSYVSVIDLKRVFESVYLRSMMDQAAVRSLCLQRDKSCIVVLEENIQQQRFRLQKGMLEEMLELDFLFHDTVYRYSDMENIRQAVNSIAADQQRMRHMKINSKLRLRETLEEHQEILEAIQAGEEEKACRLSFDHVSKCGADIDRIYQENPAFFCNWDEGLSKRFARREDRFYHMHTKGVAE